MNEGDQTMFKIPLDGEPLFPLGELTVSSAVLALFNPDENRDAILGHLFARHLTGDWGEEISSALADSNKEAARSGARITSIYTIAGHRVVVTTSEARTATVVLLADEINQS